MERDVRLTRELIDQVVFGMENQDHEFYLDLEEEQVVADPEITDDEEERYVPVPEWQSVDGYNLMERFVLELRNPIYRERLRSILASGRGVFRQFKDAVRERPDIERLWFGFKQREMRGIVVEWLNDLREQWGLERLTLEDDSEETLELIATDFVFEEGVPADAELVRLIDRDAFAENFPGEPDELVEAFYQVHRSGIPGPESPESSLLCCRTPAGDTAGVLWAIRRENAGVTVSVVVQLYVNPEFRGIGLARALMREYLLRAHAHGVREVLFLLPGESASMEGRVEDPALARLSTVGRVSVGHWYRENSVVG